MSETWWKLESWAYNGKFITPVEVTKQSEFTVTVVEHGYPARRKNKAGEYFPTFEEAKDYAISSARRHVENAQSELDRAKDKLRKMQAVTMPVVEPKQEAADAANQ